MTSTPTNVSPKSALAIDGGTSAITNEDPDLFAWPIIAQAQEDAVLEVLRRGGMSGTDVTLKFEAEMAAYHGVEYALAHNTGTASLHAAMWAAGIGPGDEIIAPSLTFWASVLPAHGLGASAVFADVCPDTLCLDPRDVERRIGPRTKAIVAVHYCGYPCDMDALMGLARAHDLKVIEDVSHAHGACYKGRLVGSIGHIGAMSLMSGKPLAIGEGGMLLTNDRGMYERAVAFGHFERTRWPDPSGQRASLVGDAALRRYAGLPIGGVKYRMHQLSSALGRVQLREYPDRLAAIQSAMNRFWDLVELRRLPGIRAHRPSRASGSTCGGWYDPHGLYVPEELHGCTVVEFCAIMREEGVECRPGANKPLHLHPLFTEAVLARSGHRESRPAGLPVTELVEHRCFSVPWFKHDRVAAIERHVDAFEKVTRILAQRPRR